MSYRNSLFAALLAITALVPAFAKGAEPVHPEPIIMMPDQIKWGGRPGGTQSATVFGDTRRTGPFISIAKWAAPIISKPHYHLKTRTFIVLKGHWDFGHGPHYDISNMTVVPEGGVVVVPAGSILYDGCKQAPCVIETVGEGDDPEYMVDENGKTLPSRDQPRAKP